MSDGALAIRERAAAVLLEIAEDADAATEDRIYAATAVLDDEQARSIDATEQLAGQIERLREELAAK